MPAAQADLVQAIELAIANATRHHTHRQARIESFITNLCGALDADDLRDLSDRVFALLDYQPLHAVDTTPTIIQRQAA